MTKVVGQRIRLRLWLQDVECPIISCHVSNNIRSAAQVRVLYTAALRKVLPGTRVLVGFLHTDGSYRVLFLGHLHAVKFQDAASSKEATLECAMDFALLERFPAYAWTINETVFQKIRQFSGATTLFSSVTDSQFTALLQQYFSPQRVVNTPGAPFSGPARGVIAIVEAAMGLAPVAQKPPTEGAPAPPAAGGAAASAAATEAETQTPSANEYFAVMGAQSQILRQIVGLGLDIKTDKLFRALVSTHLLDAAVQQMSGVQSIGDILQTIMFNLCHVIYTVPTAGYRTVLQQTQEYDAERDRLYPVNFDGSWADLLAPFFREDMTFIEKGGVDAANLATEINAVRALCAQATHVATNGTLSLSAWSTTVGENVVEYYSRNSCIDELVYAVRDAGNAAASKVQDQVVTTLVLPNLYFARPPACNVIGPDQISSLDYAVPYMDRPTRAILFAKPIPDRGTPQQSNNLLTLAAFSPKAAATDSSDNLQFNLLDHERVTGVVMRQFDITAIQALLKTDGGEGETALTAQGERQRLADYRFIEERYKDTTLSVSGPFNPHLCPGLPCIVYDDGKRGGRPKETYHGFIQSIQHSITESSAATMYTLTHVHTASENIAWTILGAAPEVSARENFIKALHDAVSPRWLDNSYAYDNIGESVYRPLLGCDAADPNRLAISLRERNLANVDAVLSPSATYKVAACAITRECPTGTDPTTQPGSTPVADAAVKVLEQRREAAKAYANSAKPRGFGDAQ